MTLKLENLELENIRDLMFDEIERDIKENRIYISRRLKEDCKGLYIQLLKSAIQNGSDNSLAQEILTNNCLKATMPKKTPSGGMTIAKVPKNAHITLAEGELNRFYIRALCIKAKNEGFQIEAYRSKEVIKPRSGSKKIIGKTINPEELLKDLRTNIGEEPSLKMPGGPNSGISVKKKI